MLQKIPLQLESILEHQLMIYCSLASTPHLGPINNIFQGVCSKIKNGFFYKSKIIYFFFVHFISFLAQTPKNFFDENPT